MKRILFTLVAMIAVTLQSNAISYTQARDEALFLTDKMAYELNLSQAQYDAVYEINLDYLMALNSSSDISGTYWTRRNIDLSYVLSAAQYNKYTSASYFYRPVSWSSGWRYNIYTRYTNRSTFYFGRPTVYTTYKGAHSWRNNGNSSWYRGKTYDSKTAMKPVTTGTKNHSTGQNTTVRTQKTSTANNSGSWRTTTKSNNTGKSTTTSSRTAKTSSKTQTTSKSKTTTNTGSGNFGNGRK